MKCSQVGLVIGLLCVMVLLLSEVPNAHGSLLGGQHHHDHHHHHDPSHEHHHMESGMGRQTKMSNERSMQGKKKGRSGKRTGKRGGGRRKNSRPFFFRIPRTNFSCRDRAPGYYADMEAECGVYHMCTARGGGQAFLCPEGTKFNQRTLVCDHARRVKCEEASSFFHRNVIIHEASMRATPRAKSKQDKKKMLEKRPRLQSSPVIHIKRPNIVRAKSNGRMSFAPLFEQSRRQNRVKLEKMVKDMEEKRPKERPKEMETRQQQNKVKVQRPQEDLLLGLPELPKQQPVRHSPIFNIRPKPRPEVVVQVEPLESENLNNSEKLQLLPPVEASQSVARFRQDPEQPALSLLPPPPPPPKATTTPFQFVGHVMTGHELSAFPDSPIVNISLTSDARVRTQPSPLAAANEPQESNRAQQQIVPRRSGKSNNRLGLPVQLPSALVWISPASLARSPMVNVRQLNKARSSPANVERTLTMTFPGRQTRRFETSCLTCLSRGGPCPHCLVVR